ncbi:MAG: metal ABC transporter permease [Phycisphaerales bacterium]
MRTIEYLFTPELASTYWAIVVAGLAIAVFAGALSVLVVVKRLAFIGQGVSHAAFGGVGLAYLIGVGAGSDLGGRFALLGVLLAFSLAAALGIAWLGERSGARTDTAIGIVLAVSMALGFVLLREAGARAAATGSPAPPAIEGVLFGSVVTVTWLDAWIAVGTAALLLGAMFLARRPMLFWAFDERVCEAFGAPGAKMKILLLCLLAIAVVVTVKLAGVVLATALFVLPGAISLRLADRLWVVIGVSIVAAVVGVLGGLVISFESNLQVGPGVVLALAAMYALSMLTGVGTRRLA